MVLRLRTFGLLIVALLLCSLTPISSLTDDEVYFEESGMEFGPLQNSTQSSLTRHKDLIPIHSEDIIGTVLVAAGLLVAASGGVGGGGILVPLYILVFGFHPKLAIALSNFTILGASIMNMALNFQKRHPFVDRPLVDWDVVAIMQPLTMAGTLLGAFFGLYLPDEVILLLLILLLSFTTHATIKKGLSQHSKESSGFSEELTAAAAMKMAMDKSLDDTLEEEKSGLLGAVESDDDEVGNISEEKPHRNEAASSRRPMDPELREILAAERHTPVYKVSILSIMFVGIIFLNVLKGGKGGLGSPVGITCGSFPYWSLTAGIFIWIAAFYWHLRSTLIEEWKCKKRLRYRYQEGDIEWTPYNTLYYPALCTIAGLFAGMFGIGGGIVMGPLMLEMGIHPLVVSATSAVMIFYTAFTGASAYMAFGLITWDYAWFLFVVGLISTAVGQFGGSYLVEKYKRTSYITLSIGAVVAISTALLTLESIVNYGDTASDVTSLCQD